MTLYHVYIDLLEAAIRHIGINVGFILLSNTKLHNLKEPQFTINYANVTKFITICFFSWSAIYFTQKKIEKYQLHTFVIYNLILAVYISLFLFVSGKWLKIIKFPN